MQEQNNASCRTLIFLWHCWEDEKKTPSPCRGSRRRSLANPPRLCSDQEKNQRGSKAKAPLSPTLSPSTTFLQGKRIKTVFINPLFPFRLLCTTPAPAPANTSPPPGPNHSETFSAAAWGAVAGTGAVWGGALLCCLLYFLCRGWRRARPPPPPSKPAIPASTEEGEGARGEEDVEAPPPPPPPLYADLRHWGEVGSLQDLEAPTDLQWLEAAPPQFEAVSPPPLLPPPQ